MCVQVSWIAQVCCGGKPVRMRYVFHDARVPLGCFDDIYTWVSKLVVRCFSFGGKFSYSTQMCVR